MKVQNILKKEDLNFSASINHALKSLEELKNFVSKIDCETYAKSNGEVSAIGAHIRHVVDFYFLFLHSLESGILDYDDRSRDKIIEQSRKAAIEKIDELYRLYSTNINFDTNQKVFVKEAINVSHIAETYSTYDREIAFIVSHTTHHLGIIKTILTLTGHKICKDFGKAPSTVLYEKRVKA